MLINNMALETNANSELNYLLVQTLKY